MNQHTTTLKQQLQAGIEAAHRGNKTVAQAQFRAVLQADRDNISALFWLAFVVPNSSESIELLERILVLEPTNERAKAGIRWAQQQGGPAQHQPEAARLRGETVRPGPAATPKVSQKKAVAQPARPKFDPYSVAVLVLGGLVLLTLSLGMFLTESSPAGWAAWRSVEPAGPAVAINPEVTFREVETADRAPARSFRGPGVGPRNFTSATDSIIMRLPELAGVKAPEVVDVPLVELAALVPQVVSAAPSALIGPDMSIMEKELLAHQPEYPGQKWIEVNVTTQQVTAWEGEEPVFTFSASTGLPYTPTVLGKFNIYWKLQSTLMAGADYYLPDVPYTMYFYQGYALHGAYWHNNFGQPMSHGCVNLEPSQAKALFEWADPIIPPGQTQVVASADNPGTLVVVHE
jgi:hypothetical protein